jgi:hypothetical protein
MSNESSYTRRKFEFVVVYLIQILVLVTDGMNNRRNCLKYVSYNVGNVYKWLGYDFLNCGLQPTGVVPHSEGGLREFVRII